MKQVVLISIFFLTLFWGCADKQPNAATLTKERLVLQQLDSLKQAASVGDLVVRCGDDLLSYQIKFLNEVDKVYSHAGLIVMHNGQKMVAHITPDESPKDGVQYIPVDSFLSPAKNLSCALYRYTAPAFSGEKMAAMIENFRTGGVRFDRVYDLDTDSLMYCSEMIGKALERTTSGNITIQTAGVPKQMLKTVHLYFLKKAPIEVIAKRRTITIDNLYRHPACKLVMAFPLKYFPGQ